MQKQTAPDHIASIAIATQVYKKRCISCQRRHIGYKHQKFLLAWCGRRCWHWDQVKSEEKEEFLEHEQNTERTERTREKWLVCLTELNCSRKIQAFSDFSLQYHCPIFSIVMNSSFWKTKQVSRAFRRFFNSNNSKFSCYGKLTLFRFPFLVWLPLLFSFNLFDLLRMLFLLNHVHVLFCSARQLEAHPVTTKALTAAIVMLGECICIQSLIGRWKTLLLCF